MNAWTIELIVVRQGVQRDSERRSLARDVERGLLIRVRRGVYAEREGWIALDDSGRDVVRMRALTAVSAREPVFSHWSAAILHGLPSMPPKGGLVHVTVSDPARRGLQGVLAHVFPLRREEVVLIGGLLVTGTARTVVDVAGASSFSDGLVTADGALAAGVPRELLDQAVDLAGPRRAGALIGDVILFAHPGAESANESKSRSSMFVLGVEPPELQHEFRDRDGLIGFADDWWHRQRAVGEADGAKKYLDPRLTPKQARQVVYEEKRREDRLRAQSSALARWGWAESCEPRLLGPVLARIGVHPLRRRPTLGDWAAIARAARPRRPRRGFVPS